MGVGREEPTRVAVVPFWRHDGAMVVTLSIKNAPVTVVDRLKKRAQRHHRSLQGELLALIEAAAREEEASLLGPVELVAAVRAAGVSSRGSSASLVRRMREERDGARRR
jgi:plasmid stability protein